MSLINLHSLGITSSLQFIDNSVSDIAGYLPIQSPSAPKPPFSAIYAFGDSLSDAGNDYLYTSGKLPNLPPYTGPQVPVSPPYDQGHFSNGPTWVEDLSQSLGLGRLAPSLSPPGTPNATDFAFGHAETGSTALHTATPGDLDSAGPLSQLAMFEAAYPTPKPDALYTLTIGSVDVFDAISAFPKAPLNALSAMHSSVANVDNFVEQIAAHGGKNFLVLNVPDLGKTPAYTSEGSAASHLASALSALFDQELSVSLKSIAAHDHLNMDIVDTFGLLDKGIANPALFGFKNVTDPVWTGNNYDPNSGYLRATTPAAQNRYLFWDGVHPTEGGHLVLAGAAAASLGHVA